MSSAISVLFVLSFITIILNHFPDVQASSIKSLNVPLVVRNGTGPVDLSCIYEVKENENGLVIKWYHELDQIYQWIPPMPPQDLGIITGFAEYPIENLKHPNSRSIIRLNVITLDMAGEYICTISTFQEEAAEATKMIVYVPESKSVVHVSTFNESHLNLTCTVEGAQPRPILTFYIEGIAIDDDRQEVYEMSWLYKDFRETRSIVVQSSMEPTVIECEIFIPETDYRRRERIVYYPSSNRSNFSRKSQFFRTYSHFGISRREFILENTKMNRVCVIMFLAVCALWTFGETLSCDQCGRECADICGTRQFRACCFNNMRKRHSDFGLKFWMRPRRYAIYLHPAYNA